MASELFTELVVPASCDERDASASAKRPFPRLLGRTLLRMPASTLHVALPVLT